uniref:NADH-ubiquinone oxidoreductase chain 5 n=1 Tax=Loxosceles similis TaxID=321804 RepID=A0A4P8VXF9_LOXSM|nr:NADH dehydrogenase subunit 5 [Loxosceles similis]QCS26175.1 NADH dehydrogenase subunit 5 [Loxosceles similis]
MIMMMFLFTFNLTLKYDLKIFSLSWALNTDPNLNMEISLILDWMSLPFASTIIFISSLIFIFSLSYIPKHNHKHFFLMMFLFVTSMLMLVFTDNMIMLILGWDGLGLTSYILVMFYQNANSTASGNITILSNRIGDMMILMAIALMSMTNNFHFMNNENFTLLTTMMLLIAAVSKSAQFPLSAWLPAAMAAPTPISALVHSSTLVTAGTYILMRIMSYPSSSAYILMLLSSMTAFSAGLAANWEQDMKKIIALSTLSQIALISFATSIGQPKLAFFHMNMHAMFKSTLFLNAGYLIHTSSYQDMRMINSQQKNNPSINVMMIINSLALMGLPFLSGYYSKDAIMENMMMSFTNMLASILMIMTLGLTTSYTMRMMNLIIPYTKKNKPMSLIHHDKTMEMPIMMLTPLSIMAGTMTLWNSNNNMIILSISEKITISSIISSSMLISMMLQFKNTKFIHMGLKAIMLWNLHISSTIPMLKTIKMGNKYQKLDSTWNESNPSLYSFSTLYNSKTVMIHKNTFQTLIMLFLIPSLLIIL